MNFNESIPYLLVQNSTAFKSLLERKLNDIGLHSGQIFVLIELWKSDGVSQIDLANHLKLSPPTINKMVKSLAQNGFIDCRKCESDGRLMRVFLTQKGVEILPEVEHQWKEAESILMSNLTITEKLVLSQLFEKLNETLN